MDCAKAIELLKEVKESVDIAIKAIEGGSSLEVYHQLEEIRLNCNMIETEVRS